MMRYWRDVLNDNALPVQANIDRFYWYIREAVAVHWFIANEVEKIHPYYINFWNVMDMMKHPGKDEFTYDHVRKIMLHDLFAEGKEDMTKFFIREPFDLLEYGSHYSENVFQ